MIKRVLKPRQHIELAILFQAEDALRRRCAIVASRLELGASSMVLLAVACHADAALDDLDTLAAARGVVLDTPSTVIHNWLASLLHWTGDLLSPSTRRGYRALLAEMRRDMAIGVSLRRACLESGDRTTADWCALWTEQREGLADRLAATLAAEQATEHTGRAAAE